LLARIVLCRARQAPGEFTQPKGFPSAASA
jgi:hypothetical protein